MHKFEDSARRVQKEHEAIYRAIRDRNEALAREVAADHLLRAASRLSISFS